MGSRHEARTRWSAKVADQFRDPRVQEAQAWEFFEYRENHSLKGATAQGGQPLLTRGWWLAKIRFNPTWSPERQIRRSLWQLTAGQTNAKLAAASASSYGDSASLSRSDIAPCLSSQSATMDIADAYLVGFTLFLFYALKTYFEARQVWKQLG